MAKNMEKVQLCLAMEFTTQVIGEMIRWQALELCTMLQAILSTSENGSTTNLMALGASTTKTKSTLKAASTTKISMS